VTVHDTSRLLVFTGGALPTGGVSPATHAADVAALDGRLDALEAPGSVSTADIADNAVTNVKLADMAEARIKGRAAGAGTGDPQDLTASQARTAMGLGTAATADADDFATASGLSDEITAREAADNLGDIIRLSSVTGAANAATGTVQAAQAHIAITGRQRIQSLWPTTNTAANPTLTIGATAYTIKRRNGSALAAGDLRGGAVYDLVLDPDAVNTLRLMGAVAVADITGLAGTLGASDFSVTTLGKAAALITGSPANANTYVLADPAEKSGAITRLRLYALANGAIWIKVFSLDVDQLTQIGPDYPVPVSTGQNDITALPEILVPEGCYVGFYVPSGILAYQFGGTETTSGWYSAAPSGAVRVVAAVDPVTTNPLQLSFTLDPWGVAVAGAGAKAAAEINDRLTAIVGQAGNLASAAPANANTYVQARPATDGGVIEKLRIFALDAGSVLVKVFDLRGGVLVQVGSDYSVSVAAGLNEILRSDLPEIIVPRGHYIGFYVPSGLLSYVFGGVDLSGGWFSSAPAGNVSSFTPGAAITTNPLQIGFSLDVFDYIARAAGAGDAATEALDAAVLVPPIGEAITDAAITGSGLTLSVSATVTRYGQEVAVATEALTFTAPDTGFVRYDLVTMNALTRDLAVQAGTAREDDPTVGIPAPASSLALPVYLARVVPSGVSEAVPLWRLYHDDAPRTQKWLDMIADRNRDALKKTIGKIRRGYPLRIAGFGDSITAIQRDVPSTTVANGANRDRGAAPLTDPQHYLRDAYGADIVDALPLYTSVQLGRSDDGAGTVHTRVGAIWQLVAALERYGYTLGTDLFYDNWGVSGAISQGIGSTWLAAVAGSSADLVIHAFGMNERGSDASEARMAYAAQTIMATGKDVLFTHCPRPRVGPAGTLETWQYTNRVIDRVAIHSGAGLAPYEHLYDLPELLGQAVADCCQANNFNHPGLVEFEAFGAQISRQLMPR